MAKAISLSEITGTADAVIIIGEWIKELTATGNLSTEGLATAQHYFKSIAEMATKASVTLAEAGYVSPILAPAVAGLTEAQVLADHKSNHPQI